MISWLLVIFFAIFLIVPIANSFVNAFMVGSAFSLANFTEIFSDPQLWVEFFNSLKVALVSAALSVIFAFCVAYAVNYTNLPKWFKKLVPVVIMIPMLLPTITYGFSIIYSIGKQGLFTNLLNLPEMDFYGFQGLLLGYIMYTLPISFLMINAAMKFIDKRYAIVSQLMGDSPWQTFNTTVLTPLRPTLAAAFVQSFFMAFTDYEIPSYIGGQYAVIATRLYNEMLGSLPNFGHGAVIAILMLVPSIISIYLLYLANRNAITYDSISKIQPNKNKARDISFGLISGLLLLLIICLFLPIFVVPFTSSWPYNLDFSLEHFNSAFADSSIMRAYTNSVMISGVVALVGTLTAYMAGIITARSKMQTSIKKSIDWTAIIINTIPGMVLGLAYLLLFNRTPIKGTFFIIIIANMVHYFSTPYLTMRDSLGKLSKSWEPTALLMGDSFFNTVKRIITPNVMSALLEVFAYFFINSMVTVSAVIFIVSTKTSLITTKIQELQYYNRFNEVFILSIMLFLTNVIVRTIFEYL